jgi:hypothetical protein
MRYRYWLAIAAGVVMALGVSMVAPAQDTSVTVTVGEGDLEISVPASANLGTGDPGTSVSGQLGSVTVTDARAAIDGSWAASVSSSAFTTGGGTPDETIANSAVFYWSGPATATSGAGTFVPGQAAAGNAQSLDASRTAFSRTTGAGNSSATWNPTLRIDLPAAAVTGNYTGTVTHSVL